MVSRQAGAANKTIPSVKTSRAAPSPRSKTVSASRKEEIEESKTSPARKREKKESKITLVSSVGKKESSKRVVSFRATKAI